MKFAKIIYCGNEEIEITANTHTFIEIAQGSRYAVDEFLIDKLNKFDVDEFMKLYGHINYISKKVQGDDIFVVEIPFQAKFWESFCSVLRSGPSAFLGLRGPECLSKVCRRVLDSYNFYFDIELKDEGLIVNETPLICGGSIFKRLNYPSDYLELLKNVESYISKKTAPKKGLFQTEAKSPTLSKEDQMIRDFLLDNKKEIKQFKKYAIEFKKKEPLREKAKEIYRDLLIEGSLIIDGKGFPQKYHGLDIYKKKEEIDAIVKKLQNSSDAGEDEVEYAIRWLCAESSLPFKAIKKNCETKYRYGCILLKKESFIDVPQEYDHILVSDIGIILIETKHWKGRVEIRSDGKWVREPNIDGCIEGIESPLYQIQRHEALMKNIFPNVPIHSLLVFSNPTLILEGVENCDMRYVIYVDKLKETIMNIISKSEPTVGMIDYYVNEIEKYKINIMDDSIRELKQ